MRVELIIIDPQNDFCDPKGNLYVKGADEDSIRLSAMINRVQSKLFDIHTTLDTHHLVDVGHPIFWVNNKGEHPKPFTLISYDDVMNGIWTPFDPSLITRMAEYTKRLKDNKRYMLCIWPPHCLIGSWGHNVVPVIWDALIKWEIESAMVDYVTKGSNPFTEHYSAVQADVPDPKDPTTQLNTRLIQTLQNADIIGISGQALSHCVKFTIEDIANNFGEENIKKFHLIEDTTSSVGGFEQQGKDFVINMVKRGMKVVKSTDFLV